MNIKIEVMTGVFGSNYTKRDNIFEKIQKLKQKRRSEDTVNDFNLTFESMFIKKK